MKPSSRDFAPPAERLLIVGLDGVTFDVLDPLMVEGHMPCLRQAIESGVTAVLESTVPPITPAAWTTFLTGKQPGDHGIIDFERYDPPTNSLRFNSTRCLGHVRNIWQILSDRGLRVGSVNVPMTYPPIPVNGFMVSGFETPGPESDFVYPSELKRPILERFPDPTLRTNWRRRFFGGRRQFAENVDYMSRSFHQAADMTTWLGDRHGWDALMVVLKLTDNLQHKTWRYLDPRWQLRDPWRTATARQGFAAADSALGRLLDYAETNRAAVLIVSDHGHGSLEGKVQPNLLLKQWEYLSLRGGGAHWTTRGQRAWGRMHRSSKKSTHTGTIAEDLPVDFARTRACVMHAGMAGFLYINLQDRQPTGIVPPNEYESVRRELRELFLGDRCRVRGPGGRWIRLFSAAHRPEDLYGCTRQDQPWLPDLILIPHESLAVVRKIRGRAAVRWLPYRKIEGTHRSDGVLVATGEGIASRAERTRAHLVDGAPTMLALLGMRIPDDMTGRVVEELFASPPRIERTGACESASPARDPSDAYTEAELMEVTERLSDLGYLE